MDDCRPCQPFRFAAGVVNGDGSAARARQGAALARASLAFVQPTGFRDAVGRPCYRSITALLLRWMPQEAADAARMAIVVRAQFSPINAASVE